ncbi:MAG: outer membrane protein assembly factor BamA [Gemmatimonadota bacterium]|nr:outer membrane protein assembly factor BamA [Gemmatimonadota bacterium]
MSTLRLAGFIAAFLLLSAAPAALRAQDPAPTVDSIAVAGNRRVPREQVLSVAGIVPGQAVGYRDIQRAVTNLFRTGQYDDVIVEQSGTPGNLVLVLRVVERPVLTDWAVRGVDALSTADVRDRVRLVPGRPLDRAAAARSRAAIDSLYRAAGYYDARVQLESTPVGDTAVQLAFEITEGTRVSISGVAVDGNERMAAGDIVGQMATRPEGFWWFQRGEFDQDELERDLRERLPRWYAERGMIDFQVTADTLVSDTTAGKAVLQLEVAEGPVYRVGDFEIRGNQRFSTDELMQIYPFGQAAGTAPPVFDRSAWDAAVERLQTLYTNNGYIYMQVEPTEQRRTLPDGTPVLDLAWELREGQPATINKINIVGNDVTHERVIREAIVMLPGEVFSRDKLIRSYQNVANLNFFEQPMPAPDVQPTADGDVDITFRVTERRTGNINFGASLGQGTGIGGFLGLEEPNLFGRGKQGRLQWQFGRNVNDFTLSYTDPSIRESRISGSVSLFDSRVRYTIADLGRVRRTGGSVRLGFPFFGSRYTRIFASYGLQSIRYTEGSDDIQQRFRCSRCTRSTVGGTLLRDTRVGLPFPVAGAYTNVTTELNGGVLGGSGDYTKIDSEGKWYAPLGTLGGGGELGAGIQFVLGVSARSGFIFGDAGPFFTDLFSLGGVQYGIPLRGYDEFSITPNGYDPLAGGNRADPESFGKAYASFSVEAGARISQSLYVSSFFDAGNIYRTARQYDPTRLFRGAGVGAALVSPLGPLGIDLAYGFDRVDADGEPDPGWQLHFKIGNFF